MDMSFLETAAAGLNAAQIILLTWVAFKVTDIDNRMKSSEKTQKRMLARLNTLSVKAGLDEMETD